MKIGNGNEIIIVDDSDIDFRIAKRAYQKSKCLNVLLPFSSSEEFFKYLKKVEDGEERMPALVLLDIRMPVIDGFEILKRVRKNSAFVELIFVMLSNSNDTSDRDQSLEMGASDYMLKPMNQSEYISFFHSLNNQKKNSLN